MSAPETIVPRWEWRAFGTRWGPVEARFAALEGSEPTESDDLYLIAPGSDIVKVRAGLMDIKRRRAVNASGLEQWMPTMKAGFPLAAADVEEVFAALRQPAPSLARGEYTQDQLFEELIAPNEAIARVLIHKRRVRYTLAGCMAEFSEIEAEGRKSQTIAIEDPDPDAVIEAVHRMGLGGYRNAPYTAALEAFIADRPPRYAVIDVGTNSVKFHIGEREPGGAWTRISDRAEVTGLGEGLEASGEIGAAPLERTMAAIEGMVTEARAAGVVAAVAVTTAGVRMAKNRDAVIGEVRRRTGIDLELLSGEEEARLAYLAAVAGVGRLPGGTVAVFDTGGGSSQFSFGSLDQVSERFSLDVGAIRFTERFELGRAVSPEVLGEARAAIAAALSRLDGRATPGALVGMGGAITNMTAVFHEMTTYDPDVVQGTIVEASEIDRQIELYRSRDAEQRRQIVGLQPKRAEVILAGACIVRTVMEKLGVSSLTVSDRGLRHGVLVDWFGTTER